MSLLICHAAKILPSTRSTKGYNNTSLGKFIILTYLSATANIEHSSAAFLSRPQHIQWSLSRVQYRGVNDVFKLPREPLVPLGALFERPQFQPGYVERR